MTTHKEIVKALKQIAPDSQWTLITDNLSDLVWLSDDEKPSDEAILDAIANALPDAEPTIAEKLAGVGVSIDELKAALGL